jgi:hypothetical protein
MHCAQWSTGSLAPLEPPAPIGAWPCNPLEPPPRPLPPLARPAAQGSARAHRGEWEGEVVVMGKAGGGERWLVSWWCKGRVEGKRD